jgi:serine protein kinase
MNVSQSILTQIEEIQDTGGFRDLHWDGNFEEYLDILHEDPKIARTSYQRLYDMIVSYGCEEYTRNRETLIHYNFFDDPFEDGKDAIFGLDGPLMELVRVFNSAARSYGTERRVLLLHGPVGTAKSTIVRLLKKGLEAYSRAEEGRLFTFYWLLGEGEKVECPMHEDPLQLVPPEFRPLVLKEINNGRKNGAYPIDIEGELCPTCRFIYNQQIEDAGGDWIEVAKKVRVKRLLLSEKDRIGIGTFQPKDEKNQDSTELTGDINYRKIAEYGSDSDPRAFNFDGELNIANRGLVEFIEILKLDVAFLYDLLTASQEHKIKPKKFAHTDIDEVILGHTNEAEYRRLLNNEYMEALRDRTIKIDVPYVTRFSDEVRIYERDFNERRVIGKHIAPHTLEMAALWSVLTRLEDPKRAGLTLLQKLKLYDGRSLPGFTEDSVLELRAEAKREGMIGISPRYIQDKLSNVLVSDQVDCINPFMLVREIETGLKHHSLITSDEQRKHYRELLTGVREEYDEIVKNEVQRAITADEAAIQRLCANYIDSIKAYTQKQKVRNPYTGQDEPADERLMRSIEEKIEIPESRKDDFRREIMNYIGAMALEGKQFRWDSNDRLRQALEMKLFEDQKDSIKLTSLVSNVIDDETQEKIEVVKSRMIKNMGYCDVCATDALNYVASIFARGDTAHKDES